MKINRDKVKLVFALNVMGKNLVETGDMLNITKQGVAYLLERSKDILTPPEKDHLTSSFTGIKL